MKSLAYLILAGLILSHAHGQGLLSIGQNSDYTEQTPLTWSLRVAGGYDKISYPDSIANLGSVDSYFVQGGVGMTYSDNSKVTPWNVGASFGVIRYLEDIQRGDDLYYNTRIAVNFSHAFSPRFKLGNNFYIAYEIEPNYGIGISTGRLAGQYLYGYNNLSIAYAWTERFSTTTSWTIQGIYYDNDRLITTNQDRLSNIFAQQFSYRISPRTVLTAEYRYEMTNYKNTYGNSALSSNFPNGIPSNDYQAHYLLAGVDRAWSERTSTSVRAGAQLYQSDRVSQTAPYAEAALNYKLNRRTNVRWYNSLGYDGSELGGYNARYSYRTGILANYQVTDRLSTNAGIHYVYSNFDGNDFIASATDHQADINVGLTFALWKNVSIDANYTYTTIASDVALRDYDRHRINVGLNSTF
jgi:opacity protein-like surface antigen